MGPGLRTRGLPLHGELPAPEELAAWFRGRQAELVEHLELQGPVLRVALHPAAADLVLAIRGGEIRVEAETDPVGPGFHAALLGALKALGAELGISWELEAATAAELERRALAWLDALTPPRHLTRPEGPRFEVDAALVTALGPRDEAWLVRARGDAGFARGLFPWWEDGAGHALGRALARLWCDVRWREPVTEEEELGLERVVVDLRRAHELAPELPLPWPEWALLCDWLGLDDAASAEVRARAGDRPATIGYRRGWLRAPLPGGCTLRIPGDLATARDPDGSFRAWLPGREVRLVPARPAALPHGATPLELPGLPAGYEGRAGWERPAGAPFRLSAVIAHAGVHACLEVDLEDPADLGWAAGIVGSLRWE